MAHSDTESQKPFRIVIVGAGIVGLSLSHALQLAGIDHVVLEKHHEIVSVRGAALIIWPAVARIFDQFGILDNILKSHTPISRAVLRWPDGTFNSEDRTVHTLSELYVALAFLVHQCLRCGCKLLIILQLRGAEHPVRSSGMRVAPL